MSEVGALSPRVAVVDRPAALAELAAREIAGSLRAALERGATASCALAGGSTPLATYRLLARGAGGELDWSRVEFFWGDERSVDPGDAASNYRAAREALLEPLAIDAGRIHRVRGELGAGEAARLYREELARALAGRPPRLDLVLLGLGDDGHTASLFPGGPPPAPGKWVAATRAPVPPHERVSLTLPVLNAASRVLFLVSGTGKAPAVARVLGGDSDLPATGVAPRSGGLVWLLDEAAAGDLPTKSARPA